MMLCVFCVILFFFFKQKTAYEMRISDWSPDVCSSDLVILRERFLAVDAERPHHGEIVEGEEEGILAVGSIGMFVIHPRRHDEDEIGRASCRERVCQYV